MFILDEGIFVKLLSIIPILRTEDNLSEIKINPTLG